MKPRSMKKSHRDFDGEFHEGTHKQETARAVQVDDKEGLTGSTMPARIDIEDTGCGIAEENIGKLSTPFPRPRKRGKGLDSARLSHTESSGTAEVTSAW